MSSSEILEYLDQAIEAAEPPDLPAIMGVLEAAKGKAWARLSSAPATAAPDENLSIKEAARRMGVSDRWLYRKARTLPFTVRIGRSLLFSSRGLERWISQRRGRRT
jgi:excisionase family DNA binding protein